MAGAADAEERSRCAGFLDKSEVRELLGRSVVYSVTALAGDRISDTRTGGIHPAVRGMGGGTSRSPAPDHGRRLHQSTVRLQDHSSCVSAFFEVQAFARTVHGGSLLRIRWG